MKKSLCVFPLIMLFLTDLVFCEASYIVQKGDTLYSISKKYQLTVAELRTANNLSESDVLKAGQKLVIPEADISNAAALSASKTAAAPVAEKTVLKTKNYTVVKGDTLYGISRKNNMSVAQLLELNNLDSTSVIKVGQKLKIYDNSGASNEVSAKPVVAAANKTDSKGAVETLSEPLPDTRTYGKTITADSTTKWPVKNPSITQVKGKVSGVQLSASANESVTCIHEGTVMYVGTYRGFGQVVFVQSKTGLIYAYTGLGTVSVKKSDYAVSGAQIGTAGVDSISGNSQITLMVFQNGQPIDPRTAPRN